MLPGVATKPTTALFDRLLSRGNAAADDDDEHEGEGGAADALPRVNPGGQLGPIAAPADITALVHAFVAGGPGQRTPCIASQHTAAKGLTSIAYASAADAMTIALWKGLLKRVERNAAAAEGSEEAQLAYVSLALLAMVVNSCDAAACMRVAENRDLLRTLVLLVARGPVARVDGDRDAAVRQFAAGALLQLATSADAVAAACNRVVDALSDADLQALVEASVSLGKSDEYTFNTVDFLSDCRFDAPLLRRLVGPAGLPLALAKFVACEGPSGQASSCVCFLACIFLCVGGAV